jgi:hypothetical protein
MFLRIHRDGIHLLSYNALNSYIRIFIDMLSTTENLIISFDRAHRVVLGTRIQGLGQSGANRRGNYRTDVMFSMVKYQYFEFFSNLV